MIVAIVVEGEGESILTTVVEVSRNLWCVGATG